MDDMFDPAGASPNAAFLKDVLHGLAQAQKTLPCQYLYDETGSNLFEQITALPEYYPTRTEIAILQREGAAIADQLGAETLLVEYGAGASTKTRILLSALERPAGYVPIDVSEDFLLQTADQLRAEYPDLPIHPIVSDFMAQIELPAGSAGHPAGFFPGSTLGNLSDDEIVLFTRAARSLLGDDGNFLIGIDLRKPASILIPAYDDATGVTARFNLNLLHRINRDLDATFDLGAFAHRAIWNDAASRIEMHLESLSDQTVQIGGQTIAFKSGETIHTENSRKFSVDALVPLLDQTGWQVQAQWRDAKDYFAVILLRAR